MITHSIIVPQNNQTKLYQLAGRLNGYFKDKNIFGNQYNKPLLYCDKITQNQLIDCEKIALGEINMHN